MDYRLLFTLVVFGLLIAAILMSSSFEPYKKAAGFASGNRFITLTEDGDIVLQPVKDVDTAIDTAAGSITADVSAAYQTKSAARSYQNSASGTFQTKAEAAAMKKSADIAYQPAGNYLTKGSYYRIWNKDKDQSILRWGDQVKADGYKNSKDDDRYFKLDN
jgi:hypothetical protein